MRSFSRSLSFRPGSAVLAILASIALASSARASGSSPAPRQPPPPQAMPSTGFTPGDSAAVPGRVEAEKSYAKGWDMSQEAKRELTAGKSDSAKKRFGKALKKFKEATEIDPTYYQAWNMVGYCSRKSGDLKHAFEAYKKCLELEPEYAPAHEYLGEAYLMSGDVAKAKEQLLWLVSRKSEEAGTLTQRIEEYQKGGAAASGADSTSKGGGW